MVVEQLDVARLERGVQAGFLGDFRQQVERLVLGGAQARDFGCSCACSTYVREYWLVMRPSRMPNTGQCEDRLGEGAVFVGRARAPVVGEEFLEQVGAATEDFVVDGGDAGELGDAAGDAVADAEQRDDVAAVGVEAQRAGGAGAGAG